MFCLFFDAFGKTVTVEVLHRKWGYATGTEIGKDIHGSDSTQVGNCPKLDEVPRGGCTRLVLAMPLLFKLSEGTFQCPKNCPLQGLNNNIKVWWKDYHFHIKAFQFFYPFEGHLHFTPINQMQNTLVSVVQGLYFSH